MEQAEPQIQPKGFPFPNGAAKTPQRRPPPPPPPAAQLPADVFYRECLKNHAASLGSHAVDGCGEFMPSQSASPADPSSLKCAACGCHRNFHRRVPIAGAGDDEIEGEGEDDGRRRSSSPPPPSFFNSAPHTLLALSRNPRISPPAAGAPLRKRFRSKFSPEQKGRMLELSERLQWRMQKRDEGVVEEYCREIGVGIGVFKIWMHNNKYHLFGSRRVDGGVCGRSTDAGVVDAGAGGLRRVEGNGSGVDSGEADGNGMNGGSSSSS